MSPLRSERYPRQMRRSRSSGSEHAWSTNVPAAGAARSGGLEDVPVVVGAVVVGPSGDAPLGADSDEHAPITIERQSAAASRRLKPNLRKASAVNGAIAWARSLAEGAPRAPAAARRGECAGVPARRFGSGPGSDRPGPRGPDAGRDPSPLADGNGAARGTRALDLRRDVHGHC